MSRTKEEERAYYAKNKATILANRARSRKYPRSKEGKKYRLNNPEKRRESGQRSTWRRRGVDPVAAALAKASSTACAICGAPKVNNFAVDHCHNTGRIRGVLCLRCNAGLGLLGDTYAAVQRAADYLLKAETLANGAQKPL